MIEVERRIATRDGGWEDWELTRMIAPAHPVASNAGLAGHFDPIYDHRERN